MKHILVVFIIAISLSISCKSDSKEVVTYPDVWNTKQIPAFTNGLIVNDKVENDNFKTDNIVYVHTDASFEEIYKWHTSEFADKGWKNVKNTRKNIGQEDEVIILVHTKGKVKHSATVLKGTSEKQEIKNIVSVFGE